MNIRDLEYLISIANHHSFALAAKESFVSQPALSMQIKKLEDELGVKVFERGSKKILITEIGEQIIDQAKKVLVEIAEIKNLANFAKNPMAGKLYIGAFPTLAAYYFPKLLKFLRKDFPELRNFLVEEKTEILIQKLQNGELDCAFLALPNLAETNSVKIFSERFLLAVPKNHDLAKLAKSTKSKASGKKTAEISSKNYFGSVALEDLKNQELMLLEDGHCLRSQALEVCALGNLVEMEGFRASSLETLRQMVASGNGITLIPEIAVKNDPEIVYLPLLNSAKTKKIMSQNVQSNIKNTENQVFETSIDQKYQLLVNQKILKKIGLQENYFSREIYLHWRKSSAKGKLITQIANLISKENNIS